MEKEKQRTQDIPEAWSNNTPYINHGKGGTFSLAATCSETET